MKGFMTSLGFSRSKLSNCENAELQCYCTVVPVSLYHGTDPKIVSHTGSLGVMLLGVSHA